MSVDEVVDVLGEPIDRHPEGRNEGLGYGMWQIFFRHDRLDWRSRANIPHPPGTRLPESKMTPAVLSLSLGETIAAVRHKLGTPETISEVLEGRHERVISLRYAPWELTFVNDKLEERTR